MGASSRRAKLAVLTNIIAPYRVPLFAWLADRFDLMILHGGQEANRDWNNIEQLPTKTRVVRAWGWQVRLSKKVKGQVFDEKFIHITPGFLWHLLQFGPDALISNEMGFRSIIALAYGALFRKPVWIWWEGTIHSERDINIVRKAVRKIFLTNVRHWISFGDTSTAHLVHLKVKRERILQLQNAVDEKRFAAPVDPAWTIQPKPVVLYVGQFIERKGVKLLLEAAAKAQQSGLEFSLLLVGDGREKQALQQRAENLRLKNIQFMPMQSQECMPAVYRSADLMVLPTLEDVWGLVANEAILSGIPVLCSKYAGCAEELFEPKHLFNPEDSEEFLRKLTAAITQGLPKADVSRLKTIPQLGDALVDELNRWLPPTLPDEKRATHQFPDPPAGSAAPATDRPLPSEIPR